MIRRIRLVLLLFVLILGWPPGLFAGEMLPASVKKVIDGDSLLVATGKSTLEVRLYGVDCPEYDQPYAREAKMFAEKRVLGKKVMIEPVARDSYGRTVAVVTRGENVLNEELVREGLAWVYPRYCKKAICASWKEGERLAREAKKGLWQDADPDPPWQWKRKRKSR